LLPKISIICPEFQIYSKCIDCFAKFRFLPKSSILPNISISPKKFKPFLTKTASSTGDFRKCGFLTYLLHNMRITYPAINMTTNLYTWKILIFHAHLFHIYPILLSYLFFHFHGGSVCGSVKKFAQSECY